MCHNPLNKVKCRVISNREIAPNIYNMIIGVDDMADSVKPGQFVNLYVKGGVHLLPRPISVCGVNRKQKTIRVVYAVVGEGTKILTTRQKRDSIEVLGPLGNGFNINVEAQHILLVGGGVGTPPLLETAKKLKEKKGTAVKLTIVLGFKNDVYLADEFKAYGDVHIATDSGSKGFKGNVIQMMESEMKETIKNIDYVYACGPTPMLKGLFDFNNKYGLKGEFSLEERMGCGFGACVGCVVPIRRVLNEESMKITKETMTDIDYDYKKVCQDGPVFNYLEVIF